MVFKKRILVTFVLTLSLALFMGMAELAAASQSVVDEIKEPYRISWMPNVQYNYMVLSISKPNGEVIRKTFEAGNAPYFDLSGTFEQKFPDGSYTYELRVVPVLEKILPESQQKVLNQTGYFLIRGGKIVIDTIPEGSPARALCDCYEHNNTDVVIEGKLCAGRDCLYSGDCGKETLRLKEEDIRIRFMDTSTTMGYPTNDWQIVANDADGSGSGEYFSIQDVDASTKPFTIEAGAPNNSIYVADDGNIGIGTSTPNYAVQIEKNGSTGVIVHNTSSNIYGKFIAGSYAVQFGSETNHRLRFMVNSDTEVMVIEPNGNVGIGESSPDHPLEMASGAYCTSGGVWTDASSIELKENIQNLTNDEALETLNGLNPVKYNYKVDKEEKHVGFIAEAVPDMVVTKDRKGMSPMDVVAVLTKVVQQQQKTISKLQDEITDLKKKIIEKK